MRKKIQLGMSILACMLAVNSIAWGRFQNKEPSQKGFGESATMELDSASSQSPENRDKEGEAEHSDNAKTPCVEATAADPDENGNAKDTEKTAVLRIVVVGEGNAIAQARVRVKNASADFEGNGITRPNGEAILEAVPKGEIRVQVVAQNWATFGDDYQITESNRKICIELRRP